MLSLGAVAVAQPLVLLALGLLPVLYWLLRVTPPAPRTQVFPALRLLAGLRQTEETPARTPWWLLVLRLLIAGLVILALARPVLNPATDFVGGGPVVLVVDNGWAAGADWPARQRVLGEAIDRAGRQDRPIVLLATAPPADGGPVAALGPMTAAAAGAAAAALVPQPWPTDRAAAAEALAALDLNGATHTLWLADGIVETAGEDADRAAALLAEAIRVRGRSLLVTPEAGRMPVRLAGRQGADGVLTVAVDRTGGGPERRFVADALASDGRVLAQTPVVLAAGATAGTAPVDLPAELANRIDRFALAGATGAATVAFADRGWRRFPVGIATDGAVDAAQPLLSEAHYLNRALDPFADLREGPLAQLLTDAPAVLLVPDIGQLPAEMLDRLDRFVEGGGVLVRFAGPLLATHPDRLVPVRLREGDRDLAGPLSWTEPMALAAFEEAGPFAGLAVPAEVRVRRQVLAEPTLDLPERTWARLADGTPLVTARPVAAGGGAGGWIVLFHVTADPRWSNLPLSGLFVDMLRRVVALSDGLPAASGAAAGDTAVLAPRRILDGFGRIGAPPATAVGLPAAPMPGEEPAIDRRHPPGVYGLDGTLGVHNLADRLPPPAPLDAAIGDMARGGYDLTAERDLTGWLLAAALALLIADQAILLVIGRTGGRTGGRVRRGRLAGLLALAAGAGALAGAAPPAAADDETFLDLANGYHLAHLETGDPAVDEMARAGLEALAQVLRQRTAVEAVGTVAVNPAIDELAFFTLLYWPVAPEQRPLSPAAIDRLNAFMARGGTLLIDTRDHGLDVGLGTGQQRLAELTRGLDIPPLRPVPGDHVLTRAFYLMQDFPGRYAGGPVWVQDGEDAANDGVSAIIIGANDWAAAWATDQLGRPLVSLVPGGDRQRELAFRFGINTVLYTLTGNYKADQVHVPAILERLGQ